MRARAGMTPSLSTLAPRAPSSFPAILIIIFTILRREFDVFRIVGAISIPSETATLADFEDIPRERPVYIHGR